MYIKTDFILLRFRDERNWTPIISDNKIKIGDVVFVGKWYKNKLFYSALMNTTLIVLFYEIYGRINLGEGLLTTYGPELLPIPCLEFGRTSINEEKFLKTFNYIKDRIVKSIFEEIGIFKNRPIGEQEPHPLPDRKALDDIVFDELGLTEQERKEVYWAVAELVKNRLEKARSV